jgi:hypothetical protein
VTAPSIQAGQRYALAADGGWWYFLDGTAGYGRWRDPEGTKVVGPDDEPLTPGERPGWWFAAGDRLASATILSAGTRPLLRADRKEGTETLLDSVLPATLTPEEWAEKREVGMDDEVSATALLYRSAYVPVHGERTIIRSEVDLSDCIELVAHPPGAIPAGATWHSNLPYELRERNEYLHLFPGYLTGFRDVVAKRLSQLPHVSSYNQSDFTVFAPVKGQTCEMVKAGYIKSPPYRIDGDNLDAAAAQWGRFLASYVEKVEASTRTGTCPTCKGTGDVAGATEPDEVKVRALTERFRSYGSRSKPIRDNARHLAAIAVKELAS